MLIALLTGFGLADSTGGGIGTIAIRSSSGNHRQHLGVNFWRKSCVENSDSQLERCQQYALGVGENIHLIPNGKMMTTVVQPKFLYGVRLGVLPLKVGFSIGLGGNALFGGAETLVWKLQPGLMGAIELEQPVGREGEKDWILRLEANQMIYGVGSSYGLVFGGARRW